MANSYGALSSLEVDDQTFSYYRLDALNKAGLPISQSAVLAEGPAREFAPV